MKQEIKKQKRKIEKRQNIGINEILLNYYYNVSKPLNLRGDEWQLYGRRYNDIRSIHTLVRTKGNEFNFIIDEQTKKDLENYEKERNQKKEEWSKRQEKQNNQKGKNLENKTNI